MNLHTRKIKRVPVELAPGHTRHTQSAHVLRVAQVHVQTYSCRWQLAYSGKDRQFHDTRNMDVSHHCDIHGR